MQINLPPCPPSLPILGHLHLLKEPFHRSLFALSQNYGPIFSLRLGSRLAIVVSSSAMVEECFTKNDVVFANRPDFWVAKQIGYDYTSLGTSSYGDHWRNFRRFCKLELFSTNQLNSSSSTRGDEIKIFLQNIYHASSQDDNFVKVELKPLLSKLAFNIIIRMVAGKKYNCIEQGIRLHVLLQKLFRLGISPIIGDFLPSLKWVDNFHGYKKSLVKLATEIDVLLQGVIDEHKRSKYGLERENSLIGHLLCLQESQPHCYSDEIIKGLVQDMLLAGTTTTVITVEWAMSHLLNHSNALQKSIAELNTHVGIDKMLDESDLPKLHYLHNVISETLRLHPVPLLFPHVSSHQCKIGGYEIPKDTMLLVNAWAIHRDNELWDEATSFKPERFEGGKIHEGYKFIPFGVGRRSCPGMDLSQRVIGLVLGSLVQCFEWRRVNLEEEIDMTEGKGLTLPKAQPLEALCRAHTLAKKLL